MKNELKKCPFCGADSKKNIVHLARRNDSYKVVCGMCGSTGKPIKIKGKLTQNELFILQEQAVNAWNKRAEVEE